MSAPAPARQFDVYSKRETGSGLPIYNNCSMMLGTGQTVVFENGQASEPVSEDVARVLQPNPALQLVPHGTGDIFDLPDQVQVTPALPDPDTSELLKRLLAAEAAAQQATVRAEQAEARATAAIAQAAAGSQEGTGGAQEPPAAPEPLDPARQAALEAARAHLEDEDDPDAKVDVPAPAVAKTDGDVIIPDGFSTTTEDDRPRCLAKKGDGTQCTNEAKHDHACGLAKHIEQVAALPRS